MKAEWDCVAPGAKLVCQKYRCCSLVAGARAGLGLDLPVLSREEASEVETVRRQLLESHLAGTEVLCAEGWQSPLALLITGQYNQSPRLSAAALTSG